MVYQALAQLVGRQHTELTALHATVLEDDGQGPMLHEADGNSLEMQVSMCTHARTHARTHAQGFGSIYAGVCNVGGQETSARGCTCLRAAVGIR